ncbi:MAG: AAA family ATPase [Byssovorax sp.]
MRISRLELDGIGPFEQAVFEIPPPPEGTTGELVLFEGPNGCGKSTILEGIAVLIGSVGQTFTGEASLLSTSPEEIRHFLTENLRRPGHTGLIPTAPPVTSLLRRSRSEEPRLTLDLAEGGRALLNTKKRRVDWEGNHELFLRIAGLGIAADTNNPADWAAFAFRGTQPTANLATEGPKLIDRSTLRGALSFAEVFPASAELGQILVNTYFDYLQSWSAAEQAKGTPAELELRDQAKAQQASINRFERALTDVLGRKVTIEFMPRQRPPVIRLDGEEVPLDLLGEGFRRTIAWLSDLIARLELTPWKDTSRSPFDQDFWLLLDEVDQSLHPALQRRILPTLRRLFPNARIYATTHSPFVVASVGEGYVFSIRPDKKTHHVTGETKPTELLPGQSLSWIVEEVFDTPSMFLDEETETGLEQHGRDVKKLRANKAIDWEPFLANRRWLMGLNDEVATIVGMREVPVQDLIRDKQEERQA